MPNAQSNAAMLPWHLVIGHWRLVIPWSLVIGHWSFVRVIGHPSGTLVI